MEEKLWHKSYAPGVPKSLEYEKVTISEALARSAQNYPEKTALNYMGKRISYKALDDMVNQFARALKDMGIEAGDKVGVSLPNIPQVIISNMAIMRIGAVPVQNNPLYTERELAYQLDDSDCRIVITLTLLVPRMQKIKAQTKLEKIIGCHIHSFLPFPKKQLFPLVKKDMYRKIETTDEVKVFSDLICRVFIGPCGGPGANGMSWGRFSTPAGPRGSARGSCCVIRILSSNVQQFVTWFPDLKPGEERLVGNFPVFHTAGFSAVQNMIIWQAWENIMVPRPDPKINLEILKKYNPTFLPGVPTIFVGLLAEPAFRTHDFSNVKGFFSGAAPLAADTIKDLKAITGATMCEVYGSTEAGPFMSNM